MSLSYLPFAFTEIYGAVMKGTGYTVKPTILTFVSICLLRIVLVFAMTLRHTTNLTIALCYTVSWTVSSILFSVFWFSGRWQEKVRTAS